jgi:hypothetical protein
MSCGLTSGRTEPCKSVSGIKRVYLFKYVQYANTQIVGVKGSTLTSFPATTIYGYECVNANFNENIVNDENGVKIDQSLTFTLLKQDYLTTKTMQEIKQLELRYIIELNDGRYRIGGLFKGANMKELKLVSGGSKNSLNGYQITIESTEEYLAPFIDDLATVGFTESLNLLLEDLEDLLLENNDILILE